MLSQFCREIFFETLFGRDYYLITCTQDVSSLLLLLLLLLHVLFYGALSVSAI
jgi:hypothetical protein